MVNLAAFTHKSVKRIVILILGTSVLLVGVAMIVLPGPAILVIPAGLAILATQFAWARLFLRKMKHKARKAVGEVGEPMGKRNGGN